MSDLAMTPELTKAIQDAVNPTDMRALVQAELAKQTAAAAVSDTEQKAAETARLAAAAVVTPEVYTRTEMIGGREFIFEAESEAELDREVLNAYKIAYAVQPTQQVAAPVVPVVDVAKEAELEAIRQVELEAKFKRGEMSTADYLEQSGAMSAYLAKQGIPVESLKATVERNADAVETQSWADAVEAFKQSPSGASWPGGDKNVMVMNDKIFALGLQDATDKVAALAQAYAAMQSSGTVFPGEAAAAAVTPVVAAPVASAAAAAVAAFGVWRRCRNSQPQKRRMAGRSRHADG